MDPATLDDRSCSFTTGKPAFIIDSVEHTLAQRGLASAMSVHFAAASRPHFCHKQCRIVRSELITKKE